MAKTAETIVRLKVALRGIRPPVWRRLLIPATLSLGDVHRAIQAAMGWEDSHLHVFEIAERHYGDPKSVDEAANEKRLTMSGLLKSGITRFTYTYDFGDDWQHSVLIEQTQPALAEARYPACIAGKRNCPPEDCGGPAGYQELLAILADPAHPEHTEWVEWIGGDFDPEAFAVEAADAAVAARFSQK